MTKCKVLIIGMSSIVGGVETYIMNLFENIDKNKFQIDFLVQEGFNGEYKERILKQNGKIYEVPNLKRHPIKCRKMLKKNYCEENYDVIHLNLSNASGILYAVPAKKINKNIKIITHSHVSSDKHKLQHYIFRFLLNRITTTRLSCSDKAANWMFGKKYLKKVNIVNNAIDIEKFMYNEKTRNKIRKMLNVNNKFVIGHVARFSEEKNHEFLINAFSKVYEKDKNYTLLLIGTGPLEDNIKKLVKDLNLEKAIHFLGVRNDINELYQAMDLFVLPSKFEGLPIVGVEAQASGLNCLFSTNVSNQVAITSYADFLELSENVWIDKILEMPHTYIRTNAKDDIKKNGYDLKTEIKKIEALYLKRG